MSRCLYPPLRPQSVGEVLDAGFAIFNRTVLRCLPYALVAAIAEQLPRLHEMAVGPVRRRPVISDPIWWSFYLAGILLWALFWSALLIRQRALAVGEPTRVVTELREALLRLPRLIAMSACLIAALAVAYAALVVPGIYLTLACLFAAPALILEGKGPIDALLYSNGLVYRHWWRTLLIVMVGLCVLVALNGCVVLVIGVVFAFQATPDLAVVTAVTTATLIVLGAALVPFVSALLLAAFGELRVRREGLDLERRLKTALSG